MKALILLGSLKAEQESSNTNALTEMVAEEWDQYSDWETEIVNLRHLDYQPGVDITIDGEPDDLTDVMYKILKADCLVFATPIWWNQPSSLIQAIVERTTYFDDWHYKNGVSALYGKTFGCIITGTGDGFQSIMGRLYHYANNLGYTIPPDAFASYSGMDGPDELKDVEYVQSYVATFCRNLYYWTEMLQSTKLGLKVQAAHPVQEPGHVVTPSLKDEDESDASDDEAGFG